MNKDQTMLQTHVTQAEQNENSMVRICDQAGECHSYRNVFSQQYTVYNKQAVNSLFDRLDTDFNNKISIGELDAEFNLFDTNDDTYIDADEMKDAAFYVFFGVCETDEAISSTAYVKEQQEKLHRREHGRHLGRKNRYVQPPIDLSDGFDFNYYKAARNAQK
jgi:hypothetical protein